MTSACYASAGCSAPVASAPQWVVASPAAAVAVAVAAATVSSRSRAGSAAATVEARAAAAAVAAEAESSALASVRQYEAFGSLLYYGGSPAIAAPRSCDRPSLLLLALLNYPKTRF